MVRGIACALLLLLAGCRRAGHCPVQEVWPPSGTYQLTSGSPCPDTGLGLVCRDDWTLEVRGPLVRLTYVGDDGVLRRLTFRSETVIPFGDTPWW